VQTVAADGWRFTLEANVVDDNARGSQLESSLIRSAAALARLCVVRAITPLSLVGQGTEVVHHGQRRGGAIRLGVELRAIGTGAGMG